MYYLTAEELRDIYLQIQSGFTAPSDGILKSLVDVPKLRICGKEIHSTVYMKAAALMEAIIRLHRFSDGNKRLGLQATKNFLENNDIIVVFPLHSIKFSLYVATSMKETDKLMPKIIKYLETYTIDTNNLNQSINNVRKWKKEFIHLYNLLKDNPKKAEKILNCWLATDVYPDNKDNMKSIVENYSLVFHESILDYYLLLDIKE